MKEVVLNGILGKGKIALVDDDKFNSVSEFKWFLTRSGYARATKPKSKNEKIWLHKLIVDAKEYEEVDHIDQNKLNCQKNNLRVCSHRENMRNQRKHKGASKYKGAYWCKKIKKWKTSIKLESGTKHIATFNNDLDAAYVYDQVAMQIYGEFASTNFKYD